jgi:hypothetical protein
MFAPFVPLPVGAAIRSQWSAAGARAAYFQFAHWVRCAAAVRHNGMLEEARRQVGVSY